MSRTNPVWDLPTRLFHWLLVLCIALAWWTGEEDDYDRHAWVGYTVLVLVVFRLLWGLVGSRHSRFSDFLAGPRRISAYLKGEEPAGPGHNPLGGWSVVLMLSLLLLQAVSGLFNSDDVLFNGPFYYAAEVGFRDAMGALHDLVFNLLLGLIALHVCAVLFYQFRRKQPLLQAMLRGSAEGKRGEAAPAPWWLAVVIILVLALLLWYAIANAPQPVQRWL